MTRCQTLWKSFCIRLRAVKLSEKGGPAFRREIEAAETAFNASVKNRSRHEGRAGDAAGDGGEFETATRGGGQLLEAVNEAAVAVAVAVRAEE